MDFVKREEQNVIEENYKMYLDSLQKTHQMEANDYHTPISVEQLHQAMQSSLNASTLAHNFQLPLSPRQMSTLMLKTNHISRNLNFNDLPTHLTRNLTSELELVQTLANELPQNVGRHEDFILSANLGRNLDLSLARTLSNELELQNNLTQTLVQNLSEQELSRSISSDLGRVNEVPLNQNIVRTEASVSHDLGHEIDLSHHLNRQNLHQDVILNQDETRRTPLIQCVQDGHLLEQNLSQRLDHTMAQRLDQTAQRLDQRLSLSMHENQRQIEPNEHLLPIPFHIKSEQEDDGYFYDNINQGLNSNTLNGHIPLSTDHATPNTTTSHQDHVYSIYNNHIPIPALNPIDHLYARPQNYIQNYITNNVNRENPQNLVVHRQFENCSPYSVEEFKKLRQDGDDGGKNDSSKNEDPKENLKPTDQNKIFYAGYNQSEYANNTAKIDNDSESHNKLLMEDLSVNIRGEYACYKCNEIFPSKRGLKQHVKTCIEEGLINETMEKLGKFSCSQCAYRCQSPAILKIHERTHTGEKPYSCSFCDYKSGQKNNVAKHILVHMKEKPFRCQYCDYRCAQKNNLVVHERTHTGYKPFACPYCDYRTVQKPNLVKHMYLHTDQKPFSCDMCSYRCVQKTNLTKHKQRHLNDKDGEKVDSKNQVKPYRPRQKSVKCPHCPYRCVQKSSLEKHLQFKHGEQNAECIPEYDQGLNLMKCGDNVSDETIQNLSVKKEDSVYMEQVCHDKILEPLQIQS